MPPTLARLAAYLLLAVNAMSLSDCAPATEARELIRDNHFRGGFTLLEPTPGKLVPYGQLPATDPSASCVWQLAQWSTKFRLDPGPPQLLSGGAVRFANRGKSITLGRPGSSHADIALAVEGSAEYGDRARRQGEPWVHLLLGQDIADPPIVQDIATARLRISTKLLRSVLHRTNDYTPGLHAAQLQLFLTIQNLNRQSPGYGDYLWFGVPLYDDRERVVGPCMILDGFTQKFIYTPDEGLYTSQSTHDGSWVKIDRDILPIILHGLETAWNHGYLGHSHSLADYRIAAMNLGWEVPGIFDVEAQVRDFSLEVTPGAPPVPGRIPSRLVERLQAGKPQTVVAFGTSLTHGGAWVAELQAALDARWPGLAKVINAGESAKWSTWALEHLQERVIAHHPDVVLLEFAINDAYQPYATSVEQARANLQEIVSRILRANPDCEVILQVMNPPTGEHLQIRPDYRAYYEMYREFAAAKGLRLVDHSLNWYAIRAIDGAAFQSYVPDGIHPGELGCQKVVTPCLLRSLGIATP